MAREYPRPGPLRKALAAPAPAVVHSAAVTLDDRARAALAAVRRQARSLRFAVERPCGARRARLSVYYRGAGYQGAPGSEEFRLGLLYHEDEAALEAVRAELEAEERARPAAAAR
jgi:hypothetical protein